MAEKVILADGTEREIPTQEELTALAEKAKAADELATAKSTLEKEIEELKEGTSPNWKEVRAKLRELDELKANSGQAQNKGPSIADLEKLTNAAVSRKLLDAKVVDSFSKYDQETRSKAKEVFDALTLNKEVKEDSLDNYITMALRAAGVSTDTSANRQNNFAGNGGEPLVPKTPQAGQSDLKRGAEIAKAIGYADEATLNKLVK